MKKFGSKQMCEIDGPGDRKIMVSYQTPVVVRDGNKFYVTEEWFSQTTTKHINHYLIKSNAINVVRVDPAVFRNLVAGTI